MFSSGSTAEEGGCRGAEARGCTGWFTGTPGQGNTLLPFKYKKKKTANKTRKKSGTFSCQGRATITQRTHGTKHIKTAAHMQTHKCKALTPENITPKLLFQSKKAYAYMYIIITFHISSKIPFPSVVILLRRSNGCIMPLWQAQLPPYPLPIIQLTPPPPPLSFSQTAEKSK